MNEVSIVIPVLNEEGSIAELLKRIRTTMSMHNITYEVIFIDDNSTDNTITNIHIFGDANFTKIYTKKGRKGKAHSLLEGFTYAKYDAIAMIDADLQYPPEAIPQMLEKIKNGADIVVGNRKERTVSFYRKVISNSCRIFIGKFLHNLDVDVQSGLKVFRKEIVERITLHPSAWTIDMELLLKSRNAGYKIDSVAIPFTKRFAGDAKINILKATSEITLHAIKQKLTKQDVVPFHKRIELVKGKGFNYKGSEYIHHSTLRSQDTAFFRLTELQSLLLISIAIILIVGLISSWHLTLVILISVLTIFYFLDLFFNLFLILTSLKNAPEIKISNQSIAEVTNWPAYTVLCPLYKEWEVVPQFVNAMEALDYPKDKLQVMLLLEENDQETIEKISHFNLPKNFAIVIVPHSNPKTKPKALNYGLLFATGEYAVIYDAEDIPDILQLKKAVLAFRYSSHNTVCIQAKLNFYNSNFNLLTRLFTAEYSLWFDLVLPGLHALKAPIPLGGTSNHFKVASLHQLKGWDAFNVTEDADLGIRLAKKGFRTAIVDSTTLEEANANLLSWIGQRSRWIKGYIQTYFVHMRNPKELLVDWKHPHILIFQLIIGGKILSMFINPVLWILTIIYFTFRTTAGPVIESFFPTPILYIGVVSLIFGNFLYLYYYMVGCAKRQQNDLIKYAFFVPFYWIAMSIAAIKAVDSIIRNPHYWAKTKHGLHLQKEKELNKINWFPNVSEVFGNMKGNSYEKTS